MNPSLRIVICLTLSLFAFTDRGRAADFIRGDANGDRRVSFADAWAIYDDLFAVTPDWQPSPCPESLDVNNSGSVDIVDIASLLVHLFAMREFLPDPFPEIGPDPHEGEDFTLPCEEYGSGETMDDPAARLEILSAHASGGDDNVPVSASTSHGDHLGGRRVLETIDQPSDNACDDDSSDGASSSDSELGETDLDEVLEAGTPPVMREREMTLLPFEKTSRADSPASKAERIFCLPRFVAMPSREQSVDSVRWTTL